MISVIVGKYHNATIGYKLQMLPVIYFHTFFFPSLGALYVEKRLNFQFFTKDPFVTGPEFIFHSSSVRSDSSCQRKPQGPLNSRYCSAKETNHLLLLSLQNFSGERSIQKTVHSMRLTGVGQLL